MPTDRRMRAGVIQSRFHSSGGMSEWVVGAGLRGYIRPCRVARASRGFLRRQMLSSAILGFAAVAALPAFAASGDFRGAARPTGEKSGAPISTPTFGQLPRRLYRSSTMSARGRLQQISRLPSPGGSTGSGR